MKFVNTRTGAETNIFSEADWKSGVPQRYGWVKQGEEKKVMPRELVDFVFRPKHTQRTDEPKAVIEPEVVSDPKPAPKKRAKRTRK